MTTFESTKESVLDEPAVHSRFIVDAAQLLEEFGQFDAKAADISRFDQLLAEFDAL